MACYDVGYYGLKLLFFANTLDGELTWEIEEFIGVASVH